MNYSFNSDKTKDAIVYLLDLNSGFLSYSKLVTLLSLADKESLSKQNKSISSISFENIDGAIETKDIFSIISSSPNTFLWGGYYNHKSFEEDRIVFLLDKNRTLYHLSEEDKTILNNVNQSYKENKYCYRDRESTRLHC